MQKTFPLILITSLFVPALLGSQKGAARKEYRSGDGSRVVISAIRKWTSDPAYLSHESKLDFYSPNNELLCALDRLDSLVSSGHKSKHALSCTEGKVIHPDAQH